MKIMKKILKSRVLLVVVTIILTGSISVYAARKYYASDIEYKETTLDKALDTLYTKTKTYKNLTETTNVEANTLLSGKKAYKSDGSLVNGSIQTYSDAINVTPSNAQQVLQTAGKYMNSNITVGTVPSSYKDTSLATVTNASDIVSGKKAYLNNGTLVTGTGSICINSSFICSTCTTSSGQLIADFNPKVFTLYTKVQVNNDYIDVTYYYNKDINTTKVLNANSNTAYHWMDFTAKFSISNGKLYAVNAGASWQNERVYFIACN